ncbi:MAG: SH3 domain-containing protein [Chloroflexi bacterium]|nr:SH3 domain-containing protein [Chloroflexota bacterium]
MTFEEAESKFKELQARVQRGEAISRAEYEDQVSRLAVQDQFGVLWEINPRTGKWMYFDGAEWVSGAPPGKESSTVIPLSSLAPKPGSVVQPAIKPTPAPSAPPPMPMRSASPPTARPSAPARQGDAPKPYTRVAPTAPPPERQSRRASSNPFGPGREWIPLAIGAVVLLVCAVILLGVSTVVLPLVGVGATPTRTATRVVIAPPTTVIPTAIRLPSPTAIPPTPVPVIAKVTERTANVRAEANTKSAKVSELKQNAQITLIAKTNDGQFDWYQINIAGQAKPGWLRSDLVQIVSGDPKTLSAPGAPAPAPAGPATPTVIGAPTPTRKP